MSPAQKIISPSIADSSIGGYQLIELLGEGATSLVYLAEKDGRRLALKLFRTSEGDDIAAAARFRKEAETLSRIHHPSFPKVIELGEHQGQPFVTMELINGRTLSQVLTAGPLPESLTLQVGRSIASALAEVHRQGYVHRDLKPDNIFVENDQKIRLIDFGFADEGLNLLDGKGEMVGTILYAAPEQMRENSVGVDQRSDLYSLGIILYECLIGRPPFASVQLGELLRMHQEVVPSSVREVRPEVRAVLSMVVDKLIKKAPADRYQTAEGLLGDLDDLLALDEKHRAGQKIVLGERDFATIRLSQMPLLGREEELAIIESEIKKLRPGRGFAIVVAGEAGVGKSYLIKSIVSRFEAANDLLILRGKCQLSEQTPLGPIRDLFDNYFRALGTMSQPEKEKATAAIKKAAAGKEYFVRRLSKGLAQLLPNHAVDEGVHENQERFLSVIVDFFRELAKTAGRFILQIDDLQWLDKTSFEILTLLQKHVSHSGIIFLGTARNDAESSAALEKFYQASAEPGIKSIVLKPLDMAASAEIIRNLLGGQGLDHDFNERIYTKAGGNPFSISQYVYSLLDARALRKLPTGWLVDSGAFEKLVIASTVVDLILNRIGKLTGNSHDILQVAAVMGNRFEVPILASVLKVPASDVEVALGEAVSASLLERLSNRLYEFVHDRIVEALTGGLGPERVKDLNQGIAEALDVDNRAELFALAGHYSRGHVDKNPLRVYEVNLQAGKVAVESFANDQAIECLSQATVVMDSHLTKRLPSDYLATLELLANAYLRKGMATKAVEACERVITATSEPLIRGRMYALVANAYYNENQGMLAGQAGERGLKTLGWFIPKWRPAQLAFEAWYWLKLSFIYFTGIGYGRASGQEFELRKTLVDLLSPSTMASYVSGRWLLTRQIIPRMLLQCNALGSRHESVQGLAMASMMFGVMRLPRFQEKFQKLALTISEKSEDNQLIAFARTFSGWGLHWAGNPVAAESFQRRTLLTYSKWMTPRWFIATANDLAANNLLVRGCVREAQAVIDLSLKKARSSGSKSAIAVTEIQTLGIMAQMGEHAEILKVREKILNIYKEIPRTGFDWSWYYAYSIQVNCEIEASPEQIEESIVQFKAAYPLSPVITPYFFKLAYLFAAQGRLQNWLVAEPHLKKERFLKLSESLRELKRATALPHWRMHYEIIVAAVRIEKRQFRSALRYLAAASRLAEECRAPWGQFLVARLRARLAKASENQEECAKYLLAAELVASEQGWSARLLSLHREFNAESANRRKVERTQNVGHDDAYVKRNVQTLLRISKVSTTALSVESFLAECLSELLKAFSAERGYVFLSKQNTNDLVLLCSQGRISENKHSYSQTVVDKVVKARKTLTLASTGDGLELGSQSIVAHDLRSVIAAPLISGNRLAGVLYFDSHMSTNLFDESDVAVLETVAGLITLFMDSAMITAKLRGLLEVVQASTALADPVEQARLALDEVIKIMGSERAILFLEPAGPAAGNDNSRPDFEALGRDIHGNDLSDLDSYSRTIVTRTRETREPVLVTGSSDGSISGSRSAVIHNLRSFMAAPLLSGNDLLGVLYLDSRIDTGSFKDDDVRILTMIASQITIGFKTARAARVEIEKRELQKELEIAASVQSLLLPKFEILETENFDLSGFYKPANSSGGDWWHYQRRADSWIVAVGDVTGHGIGSAMVTAIVVGILQTLLQSNDPKLRDIKNVLTELNQRFSSICSVSHWMTLSLVEFDFVKRTATNYSCAAPPLLVLLKDGTVDEWGVLGSPVGSPNFSINSETRTLDDINALVILTDGFSEALQPDGREVGVRRLGRLVKKTAGLPVQKAKEMFLEDFNSLTARAPLLDDLTAVWMTFDKNNDERKI